MYDYELEYFEGFQEFKNAYPKLAKELVDSTSYDDLDCDILYFPTKIEFAYRELESEIDYKKCEGMALTEEQIEEIEDNIEAYANRVVDEMDGSCYALLDNGAVIGTTDPWFA
ncbi:hypothetical protein [Ligilactobacillus equi]|uniref:Uncharacterized protein n=1 Tax=Ligilactobacillus equi DSM 15833 = JCM 10991 TaxID=1423740 RepID=A0A0R1TB58_9LACO|nr:hypothetical protein [Ligilactobacillus equi]KRL78605.1 hypothetical protein FC36_GL001092 [Ligilactobacillus equi DSM 15833 = JCM 10991]